MNIGERTAAVYFKRQLKIRRLTQRLELLRNQNKALLRKNPWLGNLSGAARKAKADPGTDTSVSVSSSDSEEE